MQQTSKSVCSPKEIGNVHVTHGKTHFPRSSLKQSPGLSQNLGKQVPLLQ